MGRFSGNHSYQYQDEIPICPLAAALSEPIHCSLFLILRFFNLLMIGSGNLVHSEDTVVIYLENHFQTMLIQYRL